MAVKCAVVPARARISRKRATNSAAGADRRPCLRQTRSACALPARHTAAATPPCGRPKCGCTARGSSASSACNKPGKPANSIGQFGGAAADFFVRFAAEFDQHQRFGPADDEVQIVPIFEALFGQPHDLPVEQFDRRRLGTPGPAEPPRPPPPANRNASTTIRAAPAAAPRCTNASVTQASVPSAPTINFARLKLAPGNRSALRLRRISRRSAAAANRSRHSGTNSSRL